MYMKIFGSALVLFIFTGNIIPGFASAPAEICTASWYGADFHGKPMANGRKFDMNDKMTVAHKKLKFGTKVRITNLKNGKEIISVVRDRGPFVNGRCVDLSRAGAQKLGFEKRGHTRVKVEVIS